jgi:hypothetical protein
MKELRRERARPRAADDFATIQARLEELRRECAQVLAEAQGRSVIHPKPFHRAASTRPSLKAGSNLPRLITGFCGVLFKGRFRPPDPLGLKDIWSRAAGAE